MCTVVFTLESKHLNPGMSSHRARGGLHCANNTMMATIAVTAVDSILTLRNHLLHLVVGPIILRRRKAVDIFPAAGTAWLKGLAANYPSVRWLSPKESDSRDA